MARRKRVLSSETFYHVFNRGVAKLPIVYDDADRRTFFKFLAETVAKYQCQLLAYCLMDNHFHLMLKTGTVTLDKILWHLQSHFVRRINLRYARVGPLFQGRYQDRMIDSDAYALCVLRYIHRNPIEAGLVKKLEDFQWSSYRSYMKLSVQWPWLDTQWGLRLLDSDEKRAISTFINFHGQEETDTSVPWPF